MDADRCAGSAATSAICTICFVVGHEVEAASGAGPNTGSRRRKSAKAGGHAVHGPRPEHTIADIDTGCRNWPRRCGSRSPAWPRTQAAIRRASSEMACSTSEVAVCCSSASASFFLRSTLAARRRSTCVLAFVLVERRPANAGFGSSPPCETRSPRRHSHWSPSGRGPAKDKPSILTEPHDEPALHSITSSARASSVGGTSRPSDLAVLRLITSSRLVGNSIGSSPGATPLRILCT